MDTTQDMDYRAPGGVYLCQVNETVSCGACCGLYNVSEPSEANLTALLTRRTQRFALVPRQADAIEAFGRQMILETADDPPFPEFHHCPYVGLIGPNLTRVGCLLHPLAPANSGTDFRSLSFYGGMACRNYFCPSCHRGPALLKDLIRRSAVDWYNYGLIVTEVDLLCALFDQVQQKCNGAGGRLQPAEDASLFNAGKRLLGLKCNWPFQARPAADRVNYFFEDDLYPKPDIDYGRFSPGISKFDLIFKHLGSVFANADDLRRAEAMVEDLVDKLFLALFHPL